jgi:N-acetylneuraminic acid mutarotase
LPRAIANHATNSLHFGPDGRLYIAQGGNTGAGAPNTANTEFGTMSEQPLSAALLVADVRSPSFVGSCNNAADIFGPPPCDVKTYTTGLRNMYDFVFHSNGSMYGTDNGLGVAGTYPPSPTPPCLGFGDTRPYTQGGNDPGEQPDLLVRLQAGKYNGHPNPRRDECVFKDGTFQGVAPLPNFEPTMFSLGAHKSADGTIEYLGDAFCGALKNELLIANYSVGDDLTRVKLSPDGKSVASASSLIGGFIDPLPLAQGPDGTIYVGELGTGMVTALVPASIGCWRTKQPLPAAVLDAGGTALGGKLYVVAGKTSVAHQTTVYVYDPATNMWTSAASLPGPAVENPAVVALGGKLYVFGGGTGPFSGAVANAAVFDPTTSSWTTLAPMPTARQGPGAGAIGGKIYVAGGMANDGSSLSVLEVYDPATNSWTTGGAAMGTRRDNPGATVLGGVLHVFGGRTRNADGTATTPNGTLATVEAYDPATNAWSARAPMPTARRTMVIGTLAGRAQLMGGEITTSGGAFAANEEYDPATDTWRTLPSLPTPRHGAVAGTINGVTYVVGGGPTGGTAFTDVNEAYSF